MEHRTSPMFLFTFGFMVIRKVYDDDTTRTTADWVIDIKLISSRFSPIHIEACDQEIPDTFKQGPVSWQNPYRMAARMTVRAKLQIFYEFPNVRIAPLPAAEVARYNIF
jgi:hypothetical protein